MPVSALAERGRHCGGYCIISSLVAETHCGEAEHSAFDRRGNVDVVGGGHPIMVGRRVSVMPVALPRKAGIAIITLDSLAPEVVAAIAHVEYWG